MLKAVLFDMDGVLMDTEQLYLEADQRSLAEMGLKMPDDVVLQLCGAGSALIRQIVTGQFGPDFDYDRYRSRATELMHGYLDEGRLRKKPGVRALLSWLKERGVARAVATSCREVTARKVLELGGIIDEFDALITYDQVENGKPAPDVFLAAAKAVNVLPKYCLAVEDSFHGVQAASAAGCVTVMIPDMQQPTAEIAALCDAVLPSLHELPEFIQRYDN